MACVARIKGMAGFPTVNARSGPGIRNRVVYQAPVGLDNLAVTDVRQDADGMNYEGKVYRWLKVTFPNGITGWIRDDLAEISGSCMAVGYTELTEPMLAFSLTHGGAPTLESSSDLPSETDEQESGGLTGEVCEATIVGVASLPYVNARTGPGTANQVAFQARKGAKRIAVTDVQPDQGGGQHRWYQLLFTDGRSGWIRGDLIAIKGDCTEHGHEAIAQPTIASNAPLLDKPPVVIEDGQPQTDAPPSQPPAADSGCQATVVTSIDAKIRSGPNTSYAIATTASPGTVLNIEDIRQQDGGGQYRWLQVTHNGATGWIREDLMTYAGDCDQFGLVVASDDLYPSPMRRYTFVRGYGGLSGHWGWDLALADEPIYSGPIGGKVMRVHTCTRCTPEKPSWLDHGIPLGDPNAMRDPGWGWGFGNHIIVRYRNDQLPQSTRDHLSSIGLSGGHIFVVYAHLNHMLVQLNNDLTSSVQLGTCGNTGQSTGPHLHLEIRAGTNANSIGSWLSLKLLDPAVLFSR